MKTLRIRWFASALIVTGTIGFLAGAAFTEDPAMDEEAMMKMMIELGTPGEHHKNLAKMAGDFDVAAKMWMSGPDPIESKASSSSEMTLGGRYLTMNYKGSFQDMPFDGRGVMAYDNATETYLSVWYDNMSTGIMVSRGKLADDGKTLTMTGHWDGPGGMKQEMRHVYVFGDDGSYALTGYHSQGGEEMKAMELTFSKAKKAAAPAAAANPRCCPKGSKGPGY